MPFLLLVGTPKGGTGKTTLAVNLAAMSAAAGYDTLLVDADPQGSASAWAEVRADLGVHPPLTCVAKAGRTVGHDLIALREKYERVVVDAGGRDSVTLRQAILACDLLLIPTRVGQFDVWSTDSLATLLRQVTEHTGSDPIPARVVLNGCSTHPLLRTAAEARAVLSEFADVWSVCEAQVCERVSFQRAAREGRGVAELPALDERAAAEVEALYAEVFGEPYEPAPAVLARAPRAPVFAQTAL